MPELAQLLGDLGGTLGSLAACFVYIWHLQKSFQTERESYRLEREQLRQEAYKERDMWVSKDTEADMRILELQKSSYQSLMQVMQETAKVLQDLHLSINELKVMLHNERT